ncbi:organic cation transporter protein-like [Patiria miniata]|uniref:Major facilitator superfamily (MFS) profile domain-containing protein n=1 Tax=Patiria miniata TaxID=46514 RepID=A0A914BRY3_PATMI|nr:organic cation transporter protein-like [Patiria miniata]
MHFDEILEHVGTFGRYQKLTFLIVCLMAVPMSYHQLAQVFLAPDTDHWCAVPELLEPNCSALAGAGPPDSTAYSRCMEARKNISIPRKKGKFLQCYRYVLDANDDVSGAAGDGYINETIKTSSNKTMKCDAGWEYDRSQYHTTVVQDFNLVCEKKDVPEVAQSVFFAGVLVSSVITGLLADWIGRKTTLFICLGVQFIFSLAIVFSPSVTAFVALRFCLAMANMGVFIMAFVIGTEFVGPGWRTFIGVVVECFFALGYMSLAVVAYFVRDWRILQLVGSVPIILFFLLIRVVPESARWLITQGKLKEAEAIIRKIAKVNKAKLPDQLFNVNDHIQEQGRTSFIDLFRMPNLRKRTFNIMFNWFVNAAVYYGLSLSTSSLGSNDYLAFFIGGFVEIPACLSILPFIDRYGRRILLCLYLLVGGFACLGTIFFAPGAGRTVVAMIGKFGISGSFCLIYIYSAEMFPTPVRSIGMGLSSMSARLGSILAPPLLVLRGVWEPFPLVVFGLLAITAGLTTLLLPETLGLNMPETIKEGEEIGVGVPFRLPHWRGWNHRVERAPTGQPYQEVQVDTNDNKADAEEWGGANEGGPEEVQLTENAC